MINKTRIAAILLMCTVLCSACGSKKTADESIDLAFQANSSLGMIENKDSVEVADFFASDLCVADGDVNNEEGNSYSSASTAVFDNTTKETQYSDNIFEKLYPASTTKVMTCLLALKYGDLTTTVTVPEEALELEENSSVCGISAGDQLTLEQLLYGLMVKSGNDAAKVIAYAIAGSEEAFVDMMNEESAALGCVDTNYVNASGLHDDNHYTTVYDLYLLFNEALKYDTFRQIIATPKYLTSYTGADGSRKSASWTSTDLYLTGEAERPENVTVIGGKTGTTIAAGACLVLLSTAENGDEEISIVMRSKDHNTLYPEMTDLLLRNVK